MPKTTIKPQKAPPGMTAESLVAAFFGKFKPDDVVVPDAETGKAMVRVGASSDDQLQWALDFAQGDFQQMGAGDWYNIRLELWAFTHPGPREFPFSRPTPMNLATFPTDSDVRNIHTRLGEALRKYGLRQGFDIVIDTHYRCDFYPTKRGGTKGSWTSYVAGYIGQAQKRFFDLLTARGERLRSCPARQCGRWFVGRPNRKFCSTECRNKTNVRKFRAKKVGK